VPLRSGAWRATAESETKAAMKFSEVMDNAHFNTFAAIMRVPMHSSTFRRQHPALPFWTLWERVSGVTDVAHFKTHRQEVIDRFTDLVGAITREAPWRPVSAEDWRWFYSVMDSPEARTIFGMLLASASAADRLVTPQEVASITRESEEVWRKRAREGKVPGAAQKGGTWLLPVSVLRSQGIRLPDHFGRDEEEARGSEPESDRIPADHMERHLRVREAIEEELKLVGITNGVIWLDLLHGTANFGLRPGSKEEQDVYAKAAPYFGVAWDGKDRSPIDEALYQRYQTLYKSEATGSSTGESRDQW
jgi:hypothetical protein